MLLELMLPSSDYWHNKYCSLTFISGGSKKPAKHRDEGEVAAEEGPVEQHCAAGGRGFYQSGNKEKPQCSANDSNFLCISSVPASPWTSGRLELNCFPLLPHPKLHGLSL